MARVRASCQKETVHGFFQTLEIQNVDNDIIPVYDVILSPQHQSIWEGTNT